MFCDRMTVWWIGWSMSVRIRCGLGLPECRLITLGFGRGGSRSSEVWPGRPAPYSGRLTGSKTRSHIASPLNPHAYNGFAGPPTLVI